MKKILHLMFVLVALLIWLLLPSHGALAQQDKEIKMDARAYQKAYQLIMDEKWDMAAKALDKFIETFGKKSRYIDDALFWRCYTREKMDKSLENIFECYNKFIKQI